MSYKLIWNDEVIESGIDTIEEAEYLKGEYQYAFRGIVRIKREYYAL